MLMGLWLIALKNISYKGNIKRLERSLARIFTVGTKGPIKTLTSVQTKKIVMLKIMHVSRLKLDKKYQYFKFVGLV